MGFNERVCSVKCCVCGEKSTVKFVLDVGWRSEFICDACVSTNLIFCYNVDSPSPAVRVGLFRIHSASYSRSYDWKIVKNLSLEVA
jgi:hypothetical protein